MTPSVPCERPTDANALPIGIHPSSHIAGRGIGMSSRCGILLPTTGMACRDKVVDLEACLFGRCRWKRMTGGGGGRCRWGLLQHLNWSFEPFRWASRVSKLNRWLASHCRWINSVTFKVSTLDSAMLNSGFCSKFQFRCDVGYFHWQRRFFSTVVVVLVVTLLT